VNTSFKYKFLLFFTLVFAIKLVFGINNDTINRVDPESGRKTGYWIITGDMKPKEGYDAKNKIEEGVYVNSRKNGIWIKYWPNGNVRSKINYKNGRTNGAYTTYFQNGNVEEKGNVIAGMMQGEFTLFWPNGKLRQKKKFNLNGKTDGQVVYYYPNGNKELVFESNNGIENGSASWYYENGDKKKDCFFDNGTVQTTKQYELLAEITTYIDEEIEMGPKIKGKFNKANNDLINNYGKTYDENKNLLMDGEFKNGYLYNGRHFIYDDFGLLEKIKVFKNGVFVGNGIIGKYI